MPDPVVQAILLVLARPLSRTDLRYLLGYHIRDVRNGIHGRSVNVLAQGLAPLCGVRYSHSVAAYALAT
eukprot:3898201-Rhodomonas_salina.4